MDLTVKVENTQEPFILTPNSSVENKNQGNFQNNPYEYPLNNNIISSNDQQSSPLGENKEDNNKINNFINYEQIKNISEVPHSRIKQPNDNVFSISTRCSLLAMPTFLLMLSLLAFFGSILCIVFGDPEPETILGPFAGIFLFVYSLKLMFNTFTDFYFIIGKDTLTITKIACCKSEKKMYSPGELINVNFNLVGDDFK